VERLFHEQAVRDICAHLPRKQRRHASFLLRTVRSARSEFFQPNYCQPPPNAS
jgi:hypothetical protein